MEWIKTHPDLPPIRKIRMIDAVAQQTMGVLTKDVADSWGVTRKTISRDLSFIRDNFKNDI